MRALTPKEHEILWYAAQTGYTTSFGQDELSDVLQQGLITIEDKSTPELFWWIYDATDAGRRALRVHAVYLGTLT